MIIVANIKIVPQAHSYIIERLGGYYATWGVGLHFKVPFIDRIAKKVNLKEHVVDFPPQPVITKDNVTMQIDTVVYYQITDPKLFAYGVERPMMAIENLTATTLRNIIGDLELDETLTSRDTVNTKMRAILDEATDPWGIKINRVELKNIYDLLARNSRRNGTSDEKPKEKDVNQYFVQRVKRSLQFFWQRVKKSLQYFVQRLKNKPLLKRLKGEAEAIIAVQTAVAEGIRRINDSKPSEPYIAIKALESFEKAADGKATKIIIPSEIQGLAGLVTSIKEIAKNEDK